MHAEIPPRRQRRRAHPSRVERLAHLLNERVEPGFPEQVLQAIVKGVTQASAASPPTSPSGLPEQPPTAPTPSPAPPRLNDKTESAILDFVNGLIGQPMRSNGLRPGTGPYRGRPQR